MRHFKGVQTYSDPSYIFSGVKTTQPSRIYALARRLCFYIIIIIIIKSIYIAQSR